MDGSPQRDIPLRSLPFGSEGVSSPTYVTQTPLLASTDSGSVPRVTMEEPSYHGASAMWEKDETYPTRETPLGPSEEERDVLDT